MKTLNIISRSDDPRARCLSNFSRNPFMLDGELMISVEGFIQGIKFPENHPTRQHAFSSFGAEAKRLGKWAKRDFVWWNRQTIPFGSDAHHRLIERAIRAKFDQNTDAMNALLATEGLELIHDSCYPELPTISLSARDFCDILTRIREEILEPARKDLADLARI